MNLHRIEKHLQCEKLLGYWPGETPKSVETSTVHMSAPALWVWVALAVCEALVMEEEPGRGSECLLNQHFFDSVALESSGVEG